MARKSTTYTVTDDGRDKGKSFLLTEMSATQAEKWAVRALLALVAANVEMPEDTETLGMAGLAEIGIKKIFALPFESLDPLMEELMGCVKIVPDPHRPQVQRALIESDIEEIQTRLKLKWEVINLHIDFLPAGALSNFIKRPQVPAPKRRPNAQTSQSQ